MAAWFAIASSSFCAPNGAASSCIQTEIRLSHKHTQHDARAAYQCGFFPADFDEEDGFRKSLPQEPTIDHKGLLRRGFVDDKEL